ncbi:MAG TPA: hypothetical protein VGN98_04035, partial [Tianweitania sediminis]|nr:hypothetical protein [Tianweitania sediminis]
VDRWQAVVHLSLRWHSHGTNKIPATFAEGVRGDHGYQRYGEDELRDLPNPVQNNSIFTL